ncbi:MAG: aspartate ammonia-lyase [Prevotella sp.]|nr:aspartate ammonia-lyase [Prevotella sp.]
MAIENKQIEKKTQDPKLLTQPEQDTAATRTENDLLGTREVPADAYYGIQTLRAIENYNISKTTLKDYPNFVRGIAVTKLGAAKANYKLGVITEEQFEAVKYACEQIIGGKYHDQFVVDMIQGGAGTSTNMNANEVIANIALEKMRHKKGEYKYCRPHDVVNASQSTNDAYPTFIHVGLYYTHLELREHLIDLIESLRNKADEFENILKMGRTQLQDAVPMTLGQSFGGFAYILENELTHLDHAAEDFLTINMGATAIGTGICSKPGYAARAVKAIREVTGFQFKLADHLVGATSDTSCMANYSSAMRLVAEKLNKVCNDLRTLSSGPRCGLNEINLPAMAPGSSIMPGKVNPVIPEVCNQVAYKVIGNDLCVAMCNQAAQMELNAMEPVMAQCCFASANLLMNGMDTLRTRCIDGITANAERCLEYVHNSIGIVTALDPVIGYVNATKIAKEALATGKGVYELVIEQKLLTKEQLDIILKPENMIEPVALDIRIAH